jgi:hypothetical protein
LCQFETVMDLKARLHVRLGLPPNAYYLVCQGKIADDDGVFGLLDGKIVYKGRFRQFPISRRATLYVNVKLLGGLGPAE